MDNNSTQYTWGYSKNDRRKIRINIGEDEADPIFTITDLLPHLAQDQMEKKLKEGIAGEDLNLLIGSIPYGDEKTTERVKLNILRILNEKYEITEKDLLSSELELVPAFKARSLGFDRSMVAGYGQDDRICAFTALRAILNVNNPKKQQYVYQPTKKKQEAWETQEWNQMYLTHLQQSY